MKIKKIQVQPFLLAIFLLVLLVIGLLSRTTMNNFISKKMKEQTTAVDSISVARLIDIKYNYTKSGEHFELTLLEFGSKNCVPCKQMEPVLEEIRNLDKPKVNVVFLNIMQPENLPMMKYYGISAIPMQIMLDKKGKEFYRHYGFISSNDLINEISYSISKISL
jgi:thioredoxin 1